MDWIDIGERLGIPFALLLLLITALAKGWLVPGLVYQDVLKQRDRALDLVYKLAETVKAVAEKPPGGAP